MGSAKWDPARLPDSFSGGFFPVFLSHHEESDVCRGGCSEGEHQAPPHLVNIILYCVTGANPHRRSVCKTAGKQTLIPINVYFGSRGVATLTALRL